MDKLAPEILAIIIFHLEPPLAPLAIVSRKWQHAIEARTFLKLELGSEEDTLQQFKSTFASPHRRHFLRRLIFYVSLTVPSEKRLWKLQSTREAAANNTVYTRAVTALFSILAAWDQGPDAPFHLSLYIHPTSSADQGEPSGAHEPAHWHLGELIWRIRNDFKYINFDTEALDNLGGLPSVPAITHLEHNMYRCIDPAVLPVISAALPSVKKMDWGFDAPPRRLSDLRRAIRSSAATSFLTTANLSLTQLTTLTITWEDTDPYNHQFDPGNFLDPSSPNDKFSIAIHHISRLPSLQHLNLKGCFTISKEVFEFDPATNTNELWPSLQTFHLQHSLTIPDGQWHFTGNPSNALETDERLSDNPDEEFAPFDSADSDTSDWAPELAWDRENGMSPSCEYRCVPDPDTFVPLLITMADAVKWMPVLRELQLLTSVSCSVVHMWVNYYAPGERNKYGGYQVEQEFHLKHAAEPRWVISRQSEVEESWEVPDALWTALKETVGEDCILVIQ